MNQSAGIVESIKTLWAANATINLLVPGGILYGLQKQAKQRPFASLEISLDGEPDYMTGLAYGQDYRIAIRVWGTELIGTAGAIQTALETLLTANAKLANLTNGALTLHVSLEPGEIAEPDVRFQGKFTFIAGAVWIAQLQEFRT